MKFTDKFKAKKTENQENPANESPKKEKKPLKQKLKDSMNKKYLKNGSYSVVISAIFIVIVLVINMIVGSLPTKYTEVDVSSEKLYSISDDTKKFLKKLDKDITIYQVVQSGSEDETIKKLLEKYGAEYVIDFEERAFWTLKDGTHAYENIQKHIYKLGKEFIRVDWVYFTQKPFIVLEFADKIDGPYEDADPFPYDLADDEFEYEIRFSLGLETE